MRRHGLGLVLVIATLGAGPLLGGTAAAQDRCLAGSATLGDQRALAALRAAIDDACPCASFTGERGADRGAYRRCAGRVRDEALASGALRKQCRSRASRGYLDTTCGAIGRVACGRVTPAARAKPVSCRITPADRCADGARFTETACATATHCSDVVDWTAGTCVDVRERAPFQAGVRTMSFTKSSVVDPTQQRTLETVVWYPAAPGAAPLDPAHEAVLGAPLDPSRAPYPLVLFSHGSCGFPLQSTFLTALLAAQGFVVVAPSHPGNTIAEFPSCNTGAAQIASFRERPQDVVFVLDQILAASADPASPFFATIDQERIAMSGHSFGGLTTFLVEDIEPRVKVAIPLAPAIVGTPSLAIPSLTMLGQLDAVVSNPQIRAAYAASAPPRYLVEIENAGHFAFSNLCRAGAQCNPPVTLDAAEAHAAVLRWVRPFLELHLNDDPKFAAFFLSPPAGVVFEARTD